MSPRARLRKGWQAISTSLWFIPAIMVVVAIGAAIAAVEMDRRVGVPEHAWFLLQVTVDGARSIASAVASSTITTIGVLFSITIVVLTLAANQYTSRVLRSFTSDRGNQTVLGIFIGTYTYALLVLRTTGSGSFVPVFSVTVGIVLALASVGALLYFIGHITQSIQAANIIAQAASQTAPLIDRLFPDGEGEPLRGEVPVASGPGMLVRATHGGYLQFLDGTGLIKLAEKRAVVVRMECAVGDFVPDGGILASILPAERADERLCRAVHGHFALGRSRTMQQDAHYGISQIAGIAVKALPPSGNAPSTAMICIDHLGALLRRMARRDDPVSARVDRSHTVRLVVRTATFESLLAHAFDEIRRYGHTDAGVMTHLLDTIAEVGAVTTHLSRRRALREQCAAIVAEARSAAVAPHDRAQLRAALERAVRVLRLDPLPHLGLEDPG